MSIWCPSACGDGQKLNTDLTFSLIFQVVNGLLDLVCFNGSLLLMGVVLHNFLNSVIYLLTLVPLKMMAGGAHAN